MRRPLRLLALAGFLVLTAVSASAHVGSPNVFYDGNAGPYPLRVIVRPPQVIPGLAEITVRVLEGGKADRITVQPLLYKAGLQGAPAPDVIRPVPGAPDTWSGALWLMSSGSFSVRIRVQGPTGEGTALVPVPATRRQVLRMSKGLGLLLAALGLFLFAGAVSVIGVGVREAALPPGGAVDGRRRTRARVVAAVAVLLFAVALWGCNIWWNAVDRRVREKIFKPFTVHTTVGSQAGQELVSLAIDDSHAPSWVPLMPDHGKLMHMFLLREPGLDAFAHIHPVAQGRAQKSFRTALPPLPAGTYRVYGDVVDENGFAQTLVDRVTIPAIPGVPAGAAAVPGAIVPDADDSWRLSAPLRAGALASGPQVSQLENGGTMLWKTEPLVAGRETTLRFDVRGPDGGPASLEPYMGMLSHAVITRDDGKVFVHLHPMGTINMAAQEVFEENMARPETASIPGIGPSTGAGTGHSGMAGMSGMSGMDHVLSFPYEFPEPGRYRLWVQVKSQGRVLTGFFDTEVGSRI